MIPASADDRVTLLLLQVNTHGIQNVLELAAAHDLAVYAPSTIAVFGSSTPRHNTPDDTIMRPTTMYGITKVMDGLLGMWWYDFIAKHHAPVNAIRSNSPMAHACRHRRCTATCIPLPCHTLCWWRSARSIEQIAVIWTDRVPSHLVTTFLYLVLCPAGPPGVVGSVLC